MSIWRRLSAGRAEEIARRFTPPEPPEEEGGRRQDPPQRSVVAAETEQAEETSSPLTWQGAVERSDQITGISVLAAQGLLAEIGKDMGQFASAKHLASWAASAQATTRVRASA